MNNRQHHAPLNVPRRFDFVGSALEAWDTIGPDSVGAVSFRGLDICDRVLRVGANLIDVNGDALTSNAQIDMFFLRREEDRLYRQANPTRNAVSWRAVRTIPNRPSEFVGGIAYADPSTPRTFTPTNFGHGWEMSSDWREVAGRDDPDAPVLWVMWRAETAQVPAFSANLTFRQGDC